MVEGKLKIFIKGGTFTFSNDLYVKVFCDKSAFWKTEDSDCSSPAWNGTVTKDVKGDYEKLTFQLLDEDTFSRDDLLGNCQIQFRTLKMSSFNGDIEMCDAKGRSIGLLNLSIEFNAGDVDKCEIAD